MDFKNGAYFVRKEWEEESTIFYFHFIDDYAVRQIEINSVGEKVFLDEKTPVNGDYFLYDQQLSDMNEELLPNNFITEEEFNNIWKDR